MKEFENNIEAVYALIIDELDGNLSAEGRNKLEAWKGADPDNERTYQEFYQIQSNIDLLRQFRELDADASWHTLEQKLEPAAPVIYFHKNRRFMYRLAGAAAVIVLAMLSVYLYKTRTITVLTAMHEFKTIELPDGTQVSLNGNTGISYQGSFLNARKLELLKGEAYFKVVHNEASIFSIRAGALQINDLGTSFNVAMLGSGTEVTVNDGKVAMADTYTGKKIILGAGRKGLYTQGILADTPNTDRNYKAWMDKKLSFINTPMPQVAGQIEKAYGSRLILKSPSLQKRRLTATLHYQTIDSVLAVLSASMQLKVYKNASGYYNLYAK